jgi:lysozyme family protein
MTRKTIEQMIADLIEVEGGYSDHPADKGGPTMYGVTQAVARAHGYAGPMRDMPLGVAQSIYRKKYFASPGFESVYLLSPLIAEEMFDTGVNMGTSVPGPWLQRLLNAFNDAKTDLVVDGTIGPATITALRLYLNKRGSDGEIVMVRGLNCLQGARYLELSEKREQNRAFIYGWLKNRVTT